MLEGDTLQRLYNNHFLYSDTIYIINAYFNFYFNIQKD